MQVFQRHESVLGGIDEAIAVVKLGSGRLGEDGTWESAWDRLEVARWRRATGSSRGRR